MAKSKIYFLLDKYVDKLPIRLKESQKIIDNISALIQLGESVSYSLDGLDEDYKKVLRAQEIKFDIDLINLGTLKPVDVELYYAIKDLNGKLIVLNKKKKKKKRK